MFKKRTELSDLVINGSFATVATLATLGFGWLAYQNGSGLLREIGELAKQPDLPIFTLIKTGALMTTTTITSFATAGYATLTGMILKGVYEDLKETPSRLDRPTP